MHPRKHDLNDHHGRFADASLEMAGYRMRTVRLAKAIAAYIRRCDDPNPEPVDSFLRRHPDVEDLLALLLDSTK